MKRERDIFLDALRHAHADSRAEFLDEACSEDPIRRARIEALLEAHHEANSFLTDGATEGFLAREEHDALAGKVVDRYKLLEQIGEGGFGVVYMAEQQAPVRRQVALKVIKPGMDSRQVVARFEAERQALAMMDHPNIARVFDAGTTEEGRPYFVMELVRGKSIAEYCNSKRLGTDQRLELFCQVCQAIQHAHQKGVIHRDIKPSNVLVTNHDSVVVPKVIDFGIAKAISQRLTERTLFTRFGQMVGTPQYMSPEQAEMNDLDVDTRTDVYSLGVLLYELLTGKTPLDAGRLHEGGLAEMLRMIKEEEPPTPSSRISTMGNFATEVCDERNTSPPQLGRQLRGDLDWIVMKALEKDRTRRYETASSFAQDIQRHLDGVAVVAGPPTSLYRFRKFFQRNRTAVISASVLLASLLLGLAGTIVSRNAAIEQAAKSRKTLDLVLEMFRSVDPTEGKGGQYTTREWLDEFSAKLDNRLVGQPDDVQAEVRHTIGLAYTRLNMQYSAKPQIERAVEHYRKSYGRHKKTADSLIDLAMANVLLCVYDEAAQCASEAVEIYDDLGISDELSGRASEVLKMAAWDQKCNEVVHESTLNFRHAEANRKLDELLEQSQLRTVGTLLGRVFSLKLDVGDLDAAEQLASGRIAETLSSVENSPLRAMTERMGKFYLGNFYQFVERDEEAEAIFLSLKHDAMTYEMQEDRWMQMMYSWALLHCGDCGDAELERALELAKAFARPLDEFHAMSMLRYMAFHTLAAAEARAGDWEAAIVAEQTALKTISPQHLFFRGQGEQALANYFIANNQPEEAERLLKEGVAWRSMDLSADSLQRAAGEMNLAEFYLSQATNVDAADRLLKQAAMRISHRSSDDFYAIRLTQLQDIAASARDAENRSDFAQ